MNQYSKRYSITVKILHELKVFIINCSNCIIPDWINLIGCCKEIITSIYTTTSILLYLKCSKAHAIRKALLYSCKEYSKFFRKLLVKIYSIFKFLVIVWFLTNQNSYQVKVNKLRSMMKLTKVSAFWALIKVSIMKF